MTTPESKLHREEWDFDAFADKLKDRLDFAFSYEFGREVAQVIEAHEADCRANRRIDDEGNWHCVLVKRDPNGIVDFDDCFPNVLDPDTYSYAHMSLDQAPRFEFETIDAPVGFPNTPYLLLNPPHQLGSRSRFPVLPKRKGFTQVSSEQGGFVNGNHEWVPPDEVHSIHIEWDLSDKEIKEDFAAWLDRFPRPRPAEERRGKGGDKEMWADLRALGVWRLLKVFRGDIRSAHAYTRSQGKNSDLFIRDDDWRDARDRAQAIIDDWSHRDVCG